VKNHWYASLRRQKTRLELVQVAYARDKEKRNSDAGGLARRAGADRAKRDLGDKGVSAGSAKRPRTTSEGGQEVPGIADDEWTAREGANLLSLVDKYGHSRWEEIANQMPGRSAEQCYNHWKTVLNPNVVKGRGSWTPEEDEQLTSLVNTHGPRRWATVIAPLLPGRLGKQCRERWHNNLNPKRKRSPWTEEEEALFATLHAKFGNRWAKISKHLTGRSDNDVKNHYYSNLRRKGNKAKNSTSASLGGTPHQDIDSDGEDLDKADLPAESDVPPHHQAGSAGPP